MQPETRDQFRNDGLAEMFVSYKGTPMKSGLVALAFALVFITVGSAQEDKTFEPEYFSVFYYLGSSGQPIELERQTPNQIPKGTAVLYVIPGEKSPTRLHAGGKMEFVVRVEETSIKQERLCSYFALK
jgi:hypothetical protein